LQGLWIINPDGSGQRLVTEKEGYYGFWFPDGNRIVFEGPTDENNSTSVTYLINADGTGQTPVTAFPKSVQIGLFGISPDGTRILVQKISDRSMYVVYLNDNHVVKISDDFLQRPAWSPDGMTILGERFNLNRSENYGMQIWEVSADGSGEKQLTHFQNEKGRAFTPRWMPY
jgi:Tol biopolymer transport system component